ncbi:MAG: hypothetical protein IPK00_05810 [Deltaproteobacteria bacterium]|nr:hypothetical protein [Deltaproteobacteria bacterium]
MNRSSSARISLSILVAGYELMMSPARSTAEPLTLIAAAGEVAPDSGGQTISSFLGAPSFSKDTYELAYTSLLSGSPDSSAVYLHANGTSIRFAISGDTDPITGNPYLSVGGPEFGEDGDFYFWADVVPGPEGMIRVANGIHSPFHRLAGMPVPGVAGANFSDVGRPIFGHSGDFAFSSTISLPPFSFRGVFKSIGGIVTTMALNGGAAPGTGGGVFQLNPLEPVLEETGAVLFSAAIFGGNVERGIFRASESATVPVLRSGEPAPGTGGATFGFLGDPVMNSQGDFVFVASLIGGASNWGIFRSRQDLVEAIVLAGEAVPATGGGRFGNIPWGRPAFADSGAVVFRADLVDGRSSSGIFATFGGSAYPLALAGDVAPGISDTTFTSFDAPTVGSFGRIGLLAGLDSVHNPTALYLPEPKPSTPLLCALVGALVGIGRVRRPPAGRSSLRNKLSGGLKTAA